MAMIPKSLSNLGKRAKDSFKTLTGGQKEKGPALDWSALPPVPPPTLALRPVSSRLSIDVQAIVDRVNAAPPVSSAKSSPAASARSSFSSLSSLGAAPNPAGIPESSNRPNRIHQKDLSKFIDRPGSPSGKPMATERRAAKLEYERSLGSIASRSTLEHQRPSKQRQRQEKSSMAKLSSYLDKGASYIRKATGSDKGRGGPSAGSGTGKKNRGNDRGGPSA